MQIQAKVTPNASCAEGEPVHNCTPRTMRIPKIPCDVVDMVVDELRHDRATLRSCSLTSRAWLHRSRIHLHRTFILQHNDFRFLTSGEENTFHTMRQEALAVLQYADELNLQGVYSVSPGDCKRGSPIWNIFPYLRHVRVLRISDVDLASNPALCLQDAASWALAFPNLHTLDISRMSFRSFNDPLRLAQSFKQLRTFNVENIITADDVNLASDSGRECISPTTFVPTCVRILHGQKAAGFTEKLAAYLRSSEAAKEKLERLHVDTLSDPGILTRAIGDALPELHLTLQEEFYPPPHAISNMRAAEVRRAVSCVSDCTMLRVLRLSVVRNSMVRMLQVMEGYDSDILCSPWQVYTEALAGLAETSFSCRELHLSFDVRDIQGPHISGLEDVILGSYVDRVDVIRFRVKEFIDPMDEPMRLERLWSAGLQRLRLRCTVRVEYYDRHDFM